MSQICWDSELARIEEVKICKLIGPNIPIQYETCFLVIYAQYYKDQQIVKYDNPESWYERNAPQFELIIITISTVYIVIVIISKKPNPEPLIILKSFLEKYYSTTYVIIWWLIFLFI